MDKQVFQLLYETHYKALLNYLLTLCGNMYDAEDLAHEAFIRYEKSLPNFRKDCSDYTMLCTIGKNLYLNRKRKDDRVVQLKAGRTDTQDTARAARSLQGSFHAESIRRAWF